MFELVLSCVLTAVLTVGILAFYLRRTMPDIQAILDDVGAGISETFEGTFKNPAVKNFMSQMGKKSGDVRADKALKSRVADKALGQSVIVKKALDYFGLSALEGIELMQDPTFGPIIQGFIQKGGQGLLKGFNSNGAPGPISRGQVPNMS